ncbi:OsmC family protein [Acinetobacter nectaris]|uniref:OsmC family protein n=1 Tax=Acinetobacter nectaris TaxID=1219382 RepID=UPI001F37117D|nr:OsmC family protein [Acinetobacter nectaris]MCF8999942.1 OsmC family protein [Acinetobacter nectaris]MCF9026766.1 OsmC family protein [Acinetobacter nectaris]
MTTHYYNVSVIWDGNLGQGTASYDGYQRDFQITHPHKPTILGSADPAYLGDKTRWNPEDLMVAAASACHKLWYLHLCAVNGVHVIAYEDDAESEMEDHHPTKRGHIKEVCLNPRITLKQGANLALAKELHETAHHKCMVANSVNFPIYCKPLFNFAE